MLIGICRVRTSSRTWGAPSANNRSAAPRRFNISSCAARLACGSPEDCPASVSLRLPRRPNSSMSAPGFGCHSSRGRFFGPGDDRCLTTGLSSATPSGKMPGPPGDNIGGRLSSRLRGEGDGVTRSSGSTRVTAVIVDAGVVSENRLSPELIDPPAGVEYTELSMERFGVGVRICRWIRSKKPSKPSWLSSASCNISSSAR
ncbi:hypothetical protein AGR4C_pa60035 [Agrobacterium tumefaciens str. Kerr 14]|uniref:Uncharacterized protein n=1 Tax=Agrobacterium tumefaciens str. Kerr 14 TaxID=1183424 RepID=A0A1S7SCP5_AGRTU|nr:hypothetical protein AGR4C_pa60035 [Agrobacterium tumefaciens str. Kerr 14]